MLRSSVVCSASCAFPVFSSSDLSWALAERGKGLMLHQDVITALLYI